VTSAASDLVDRVAKPGTGSLKLGRILAPVGSALGPVASVLDPVASALAPVTGPVAGLVTPVFPPGCCRCRGWLARGTA